MLVVDLDGTLRPPDGRFDPADLEALHRAGERGVLRILATGRSLASLRRAIEGVGLPVDVLVFSSGAGICTAGGQLLACRNLDARQVAGLVEDLTEAGLDFSLHAPIPDSHRFAVVRASGQPNADLDRRLATAGEDYLELDARSGFGPAAQIIAVLPPPAAGRMTALRAMLNDFSVVRTTSPVDGRSVWIEIFAQGVSKGAACAELAARHGCDAADALAIGNDYNDLDMLRWAGRARVVDGAPAELRAEFASVAGCTQGGAAEAIDAWLAEMTGDRR
ncbi:MAG: HAD family phosphatase [Deltaproteobacteria bacterium]|nr:HAD family phosphatase [Deltaproteobacteria bacterium]